MKIKELRNLSKEELAEKEKSLKEELFKLNSGRFSGNVDKPHMFSALRRDIARIKTLLNAGKNTGAGHTRVNNGANAKKENPNG